MFQYRQKYSQSANHNQGFTIIELLIVLIVIGILSSLALPSFLNQANKAKQSEAKTYIGAMNRAQQSIYMEEGSFTTDAGILGLGISPETSSYIYRISAGSAASSIVNRAIPSDGSFSNTPGVQATVSAYLGGLKAGRISGSGADFATLAVICEAISTPLASGDNGTTTEPLNMSAATVGEPTCDSALYRKVR